jgi:hypothetical protein
MIITGDDIHIFRYLTLRKGLQLELKGMKMSRGRSCYTIIKKEFGLKGNKQNVLNQFTEMLTKAGVLR